MKCVLDCWHKTIYGNNSKSLSVYCSYETQNNITTNYEFNDKELKNKCQFNILCPRNNTECTLECLDEDTCLVADVILGNEYYNDISCININECSFGYNNTIILNEYDMNISCSEMIDCNWIESKQYTSINIYYTILIIIVAFILLVLIARIQARKLAKRGYKQLPNEPGNQSSKNNTQIELTNDYNVDSKTKFLI